MSFLPETEQDMHTIAADICPHWGSHYENNPPSIDPTLLQISPPALGFTLEQEVLQEDQALGGQAQLDSGPPAQLSGQEAITAHATSLQGAPDAMQAHVGLLLEETHYVIKRKPPTCHCGKTFTRCSTLERHIGLFSNKVPAYPCTECTSRQGKDGFMRKDHLVQHLKHAHGYDDAQLASQFPPRKARKYHIPTCHIKTCDYYRDSAFQDLPIKEQEANRPFEKTADYTKHMKADHDWSLYPCKVQGCDKRDGKGFFSTSAFERHYEKHHQGVTLPSLEFQARAARLVKCHGCQKKMTSGALHYHECVCKELVRCRYCNMTTMNGKLSSHKRHDCTQTVQCRYCNMDVEVRARSSHEERCANAPTCYHCHRNLQGLDMDVHEKYACNKQAKMTTVSSA